MKLEEDFFFFPLITVEENFLDSFELNPFTFPESLELSDSSEQLIIR